MQTGVIDGTENNPPTFVTDNYLPVVKNYTWCKHFIIPELFLFSKAKWDKLKKENQELILKLAKEAQAEQQQLPALCRSCLVSQNIFYRGKVYG